MNKFNVAKAEDIQIVLDTAKGLVDTINDLVDAHPYLFTEYPGQRGQKLMAERLYSQLLSLSRASIDTIKQAQNQLNSVVTDYYKGGAK